MDFESPAPLSSDGEFEPDQEQEQEQEHEHELRHQSSDDDFDFPLPTITQQVLGDESSSDAEPVVSAKRFTDTDNTDADIGEEGEVIRVASQTFMDDQDDQYDDEDTGTTTMAAASFSIPFADNTLSKSGKQRSGASNAPLTFEETQETQAVLSPSQRTPPRRGGGHGVPSPPVRIIVPHQQNLFEETQPTQELSNTPSVSPKAASRHHAAAASPTVGSRAVDPYLNAGDHESQPLDQPFGALLPSSALLGLSKVQPQQERRGMALSSADSASASASATLTDSIAAHRRTAGTAAKYQRGRTGDKLLSSAVDLEEQSSGESSQRQKLSHANFEEDTPPSSPPLSAPKLTEDELIEMGLDRGSAEHLAGGILDPRSRFRLSTNSLHYSPTGNSQFLADNPVRTEVRRFGVSPEHSDQEPRMDQEDDFYHFSEPDELSQIDPSQYSQRPSGWIAPALNSDYQAIPSKATPADRREVISISSQSQPSVKRSASEAPRQTPIDIDAELSPVETLIDRDDVTSVVDLVSPTPTEPTPEATWHRASTLDEKRSLKRAFIEKMAPASQKKRDREAALEAKARKEADRLLFNKITNDVSKQLRQPPKFDSPTKPVPKAVAKPPVSSSKLQGILKNAVPKPPPVSERSGSAKSPPQRPPLALRKSPAEAKGRSKIVDSESSSDDQFGSSLAESSPSPSPSSSSESDSMYDVDDMSQPVPREVSPAQKRKGEVSKVRTEKKRPKKSDEQPLIQPVARPPTSRSRRAPMDLESPPDAHVEKPMSESKRLALIEAEARRKQKEQNARKKQERLAAAALARGRNPDESDTVPQVESPKPKSSPKHSESVPKVESPKPKSTSKHAVPKRGTAKKAIAKKAPPKSSEAKVAVPEPEQAPSIAKNSDDSLDDKPSTPPVEISSAPTGRTRRSPRPVGETPQSPSDGKMSLSKQMALAAAEARFKQKARNARDREASAASSASSPGERAASAEKDASQVKSKNKRSKRTVDAAASDSSPNPHVQEPERKRQRLSSPVESEDETPVQVADKALKTYSHKHSSKSSQTEDDIQTDEVVKSSSSSLGKASSPSTANSKIFFGVHFITTGGLSDSISKQIIRLGGHIVEDSEFDLDGEVRVLSKTLTAFASDPSLTTGILPTVICISPKKATTAKYLFALLAQVPCVNASWIAHCQAVGSVSWPPKSDYLLSAKAAAKHRALKDSLFCDLKIELCSQTELWKNLWRHLLQLGGGSVRSRLFASSRPKPGSLDLLLCENDEIDEIYQEQLDRIAALYADARGEDSASLNEIEESAASVTSQGSRSKRALRALIPGTVEKGIFQLPVVGATWARECIVRGERLPLPTKEQAEEAINIDAQSSSSAGNKRSKPDDEDDDQLDEAPAKKKQRRTKKDSKAKR